MFLPGLEQHLLFENLFVAFYFLCHSDNFVSFFFPLQGEEPFVSLEGLEQLHRFIFVMAVTHIFYSCLTMVLAIVKVSQEDFLTKHSSKIKTEIQK